MTKTIKFEESSHAPPSLCCPGCGNFEIHQQSVQVVVRDDGEDGHGTKVVVDGGDHAGLHVAVFRVLEEDVPGRRQHVSITFSCEHCWGVAYILLLMQHKGRTYVEWLAPVDKKGDPLFDPSPEREVLPVPGPDGTFGFGNRR